jgi:hypothetical protein
MEIYTIQRPSLLLAAACAPSAPVVPSRHESVVMAAAKRTPLSQAYQVQTQAELARTLVLGDSGNGTTGFVGSNGITNKTDGASGVPPRGRPV